jgi:hypothetical protein
MMLATCKRIWRVHEEARKEGGLLETGCRAPADRGDGSPVQIGDETRVGIL